MRACRYKDSVAVCDLSQGSKVRSSWLNWSNAAVDRKDASGKTQSETTISR
jgi:hypothetical protein